MNHRMIKVEKLPECALPHWRRIMLHKPESQKLNTYWSMLARAAYITDNGTIVTQQGDVWFLEQA